MTLLKAVLRLRIAKPGASLPAISEQLVFSAFVLSILQQPIAWPFNRVIGQDPDFLSIGRWSYWRLLSRHSDQSSRSAWMDFSVSAVTVPLPAVLDMADFSFANSS